MSACFDRAYLRVALVSPQHSGHPGRVRVMTDHGKPALLGLELLLFQLHPILLCEFDIELLQPRTQ